MGTVLPAQDHVDEAVVVDIAPEGRARPGRSGQWMVRRGCERPGPVAEEDGRRTITRQYEVLVAVLVDVHGADRRITVPVGDPRRFGEQRPLGFGRPHGRADRRGQCVCLRTHARIGESGQACRGIGLETLIRGQQLRGLVVAADAAQRLGTGPVGALQIRVEFDAREEPLGGTGVVAGLEQRLAEKVGRVGILRV